MRLTNTTREVIDIVIKGDAKDGVPPTESLAPGETRNINAADNAQFRGRLVAGSLTQETAVRSAPASKE